MATSTRENTDDLLFLRELAEAEAIKAVIDRRYPLAQAADAHRYVETGRKRGSLVLTIGPSPPHWPRALPLGGK